MSRTTAAPTIPLLADPEQAIAAAEGYADTIRAGAIARDRDRAYPAAELLALGRTGLLGIAVPRRYGGPQASRRTIAEVFRTIAHADSSIAQLLLGHFVLHELLNGDHDPQLNALVYADVLQRGERIGGAGAERGTAHAFAQRTAVAAQADGTYRLQGRKYYTTGARGSRWLFVAALLEGAADHPVWAIVRADAYGVRFLDDWDAFGQRSTASGSLLLDDVAVAADRVIDSGPPPADPGPTVFGAYDQLLHLAIDVGIARAALEDGAEFVRTRSRPWFEAEQARASEEPLVIHRFGQLTTRLHALEALFHRGADLLDAALDAPALTDENTAAASLAIAEAKAYAQEVAVEIASAVLEPAGASSTDASLGLDRHWRNVRTHSLHDPARWKYVHIGNHTLHGINPPRHPRI